MDVSVDVEPTTPVKTEGDEDEEADDERPARPKNRIVTKSPKK